MAWPRGQIEDLVKPLGPGKGRLHLQRWADGREEVHHDKYDPEAGASEAALHLALETPTPTVVVVVVAGGAALIAFGRVAWAWWRLR